MPSIILITGIMAAGKSAVAQAVAGRLTPSVHLRGDLFRRMVVNGREDMTGQPTAEALRQLELRYQLAVETALEYVRAGFHVVYQDVIFGDWLPQVVGLFGNARPNVIVLCPDPDVVAMREANRVKTGYGHFDVMDMDREFRASTPRIGRWIDSSNLTVEETVDLILMKQEQHEDDTSTDESTLV